MLLTLLIISSCITYLRNFSYTLNSVNEDDYQSSGVTFAIYLNDGYDNYVKYEGDTFPAKADGYKYNADISNCTDLDGNNSNNYSLYYNNDMVQVSTQESVYCYIYFDMYSYDGDYCLVNGITEYLGECALVMDDYSYTVESAKESIEDKGEATTSEISPTIYYNQSVSTDQIVNLSTSNYYVVGTSISFSSTTGMFTLSGTSKTTDTTDGKYIGYYTCASSSSTCSTAYKINAYTVTMGTSSTTYKITNVDKYKYIVNSTIESENGIYATTDYDGSKTYFYRGSVNNNYVYFAGYYWRIIRINGDGSVRMIYAGTTADATGTDAQIGTARFNTTYSDPTYVGYKYGTLSGTPITQESMTTFTNISSNTTYYFGTSYETTSSGTFKLSGTIISGTFSGLFGTGGTYAADIANYYTCFSTSSTGTCTLLKQLNSYVSTSSAKVYYVSYASENYEDTLTNENDSTIKIVVDEWYEENIKDKYDEEGTHLLSEYISTSAIFCGDRSLYSGDGYLLSTSTYYSPYRRLTSTYSSTLKCNQTSDLYSVDNETLTYPIGLITADEVSFAGGKYNNVNTLYYLYTGSAYWTMSPSYFFASGGNAHVWYVQAAGTMSYDGLVSNSYGVRPVINLSSSVKISSGIGTAERPFIVTLD